MTINWQNKKHRLLIILSASLILVLLVYLFVSLLSSRSVNKNAKPTTLNTKIQKSDPPPLENLQWREKERARLAKAGHDQALYTEILAKKDVARCSEMQDLDGESFCLLALAVDLNDQVICDRLTNEDFRSACQSKFTPASTVANPGTTSGEVVNKLINNK